MKREDLFNVNGEGLIACLFIETDTRRPKKAVYTTKDYDLEKNGVTYLSLKKIYLSYDHAPGSEYEFSNEHLGGWQHWERICNSPLLGPEVEQWREELEVKLRASAVEEVIKISKGDKGFQAAKWIADGNYTPAKRGRPTKAEVAKERRIAAKVSTEVDDMAKRIQ